VVREEEQRGKLYKRMTGLLLFERWLQAAEHSRGEGIGDVGYGVLAR